MERGGLGLRDGCPPGRVVSVDPDDYPQSDECGLPVAGVNIGKLVGVVAASSLDAPARAAIRMFIRLVRGDIVHPTVLQRGDEDGRGGGRRHTRIAGRGATRAVRDRYSGCRIVGPRDGHVDLLCASHPRQNYGS